MTACTTNEKIILKKKECNWRGKGLGSPLKDTTSLIIFDEITFGKWKVQSLKMYYIYSYIKYY